MGQEHAQFLQGLGLRARAHSGQPCILPSHEQVFKTRTHVVNLILLLMRHPAYAGITGDSHVDVAHMPGTVARIYACVLYNQRAPYTTSKENHQL